MAEDQNDGDEDSLRFDKADLKKFVKLGRQRSLTFAFCPGSGQDEALFTAHRRMKPKKLGTDARKEAEQTKYAFGKFTVEGKTLLLECEKVMPGLEKKLKKMLRKQKISMDVKLAGEGEDVA